MLPVKAPRDPAPSRIKYRLERLWLRPTIRKFVRTGLPLIALCLVGLSLGTDPQVQARAATIAADLREKVKAHPGLMVQRITIRDATPGVEDAVREVAEIDLPVSSLDLDLAAMQRGIVALDIIETASVRLLTEGELEISVRERKPALVWRDGAGLHLIDATGVRVGALERRADRPELPLVAGAGANAVAAEAQQLLTLATPFRARTRALVRIGQRRWDLVLDRGQRIKLPETDPVAALARIIALDAAEDLLARDITVIDFRDARRPTLRMSPRAWDHMQGLRAEAAGRDT